MHHCARGKIIIDPEINSYINDSSFDIELRKRILEWSKEIPFIDFLNNNKNKILKKLRTAKNVEDKRDVGIELYIAFIFATSNCEVTYEPNLPIRKNPDYKISFDNFYFFCEVKRLRREVEGEISNEGMYKKCGDIICEKAIQSVPNEINIIYIRSHIAPDYDDLKSGFESLLSWAKKNPDEFLKKIEKYEIKSVEDFITYWEQISAMIIPMVKNGKFVPAIWDNSIALKPLPDILKSKINEVIKKPFRYD